MMRVGMTQTVFADVTTHGPPLHADDAPPLGRDRWHRCIHCRHTLTTGLFCSRKSHEARMVRAVLGMDWSIITSGHSCQTGLDRFSACQFTTFTTTRPWW